MPLTLIRNIPLLRLDTGSRLSPNGRGKDTRLEAAAYAAKKFLTLPGRGLNMGSVHILMRQSLP
jgi:hypothetical protein